MTYIILGTKGQFIKMFPVMKSLDQHNIPYKFISTCQHYDFIEKNRLKLKVKKPDVYLTRKKKDIRNIWDFFVWAPKVLWDARKLKIKKNDWILIHGDTESTLLALIIGKFFRAKTAHIEAGGRSHNWLEPFPEEIIRAITDNLCDIDFCPYEHDRANITKKTGKYVTNGNTVFDSIRLALNFTPSTKVKELIKKKYVIFLVHRKENLFSKERTKALIDILEIILKRSLKVIWPMHSNTEYELKQKGIWSKILYLRQRYDLELGYFFDYVDFMHTVKHSEFVASDGGGLQKETYFLNKPMLVLRKVLEKEPGAGETSFLCYLDKEKVKYFLDRYKSYTRNTGPSGSPSEIIVEQLMRFL